VLQPLCDEGRDALEVKRLFLPDTEEHGGRAQLFAVKYFAFGVGNVVLGALGEVGLYVAEGSASSTALPSIFYARRSGGNGSEGAGNSASAFCAG